MGLAVIVKLKTYQDIIQYPTPSDIDCVLTYGYYEFGDGGGACYKRVAFPPVHGVYAISATGGLFELACKGEISIKVLGASGGGADDSAAFSKMNALFSNGCGLSIIVDDEYNTTVAPIVVGYNNRLTGRGKAVIKATGNNRSLSIGGAIDFIDVSSNLLTGVSECTIASVAGYSVNDVVMVISGHSINSTLPTNPIPKNKQFFTIREIDTVNSKLKFTAPAYRDFIATDFAQISSPNAKLAVGCVVENLHLTNSSTFGGAYLRSVSMAYNCTVANCRFDGYSSCGFDSFCDELVYDNCVFIGYNGISCARGTKKITYRNCTIAPRFTATQKIAGFFEETPENLTIDNCSFIGGQLQFTSSADELAKTVKFRNNTIDFNDGSKVAIVVSFNNAGAGYLLMENCKLLHPGAPNSSGRKSVIHASSTRSLVIRNCDFGGMDADAVAVDINEANTFGLRIENCFSFDGSGASIAGPTVQAGSIRNYV